MNQQDFVARQLNFTLDPIELQDYYQTVKSNFEHLHWTWAKNHIHIDDVAAAECVEPKNTLMHGWMMQSNMVDRTIPPSMLKTRYPTTDW